MHGRSKKPCVGCGKAPAAQRWEGETWTADKPLCGDCREKIKNCAALHKLYQAALKKDLTLVIVDTGETFPDGQNIFHDEHKDRNNSACERRFEHPFELAYFKLIQACTEPVPTSLAGKPEKEPLLGWAHYYKYRLMTTQARDAFKALHTAAKNLSEVAFKKGQQHGANLLRDLIQGDLKNEDINKACAEDRA